MNMIAGDLQSSHEFLTNTLKPMYFATEENKKRVHNECLKWFQETKLSSVHIVKLLPKIIKYLIKEEPADLWIPVLLMVEKKYTIELSHSPEHKISNGNL